MLASGRPEFPVRVNCFSGHHLPPGSYFAGQNPGQVPAHIEFMAEFPSGFSIGMTCSWMNQRHVSPTLHGHKATLSAGIQGDRVELAPEGVFAEVNPDMFHGLQPVDVRLHEMNWFECIRAGHEPNGNIDLAIRAQTVLSLAEMADRLKTTCLFDQTTRKVTDRDGREITPLTYDV